MYQYKYGGENGNNHVLIEALDLVVVRTKEPVNLKSEEAAISATAKSLVANMIPVVSFPEANVTVYKCIDKENKTAMKLRNTARKTLKQEKSVRFAGRVLKDKRSGEPVVYTENFFIKFKDNIEEKVCKDIVKSHNLQTREVLTFAKNAFFITAPKGTGLAVFGIAEALLKKKEVQYCHPELVRKKKHKAIYDSQWHLKATTINGQKINQHVNVEAAWQHNKGEGITIAVIDDGVDTSHEEFRQPGKIIFPRDTVVNVDDGNPKRPEESHGTSCAGVACASGQFKASGVAPNARLIPIRSGGLGSLAEAKAFQWATDKGADIISCSWGPSDGPWWDSEAPLHFIPFDLPDSTRLAIDYATQNGRGGKGCVIVWAAGNGNESVDLDGYASYHKVIAVAASNDRGTRSYYSDYGNAVWCCFPSNDVTASFIPHPRPLTPGIWTTDRMGKAGENPGLAKLGDKQGNYYAQFGGTSSACPGVAGVIALMLGANQQLNWEEIKEIIKHSCDKIDIEQGDYDANGHSPFYGYGRINAATAVEGALKANQVEANDFSVKGIGQFYKNKDIAIELGIPKMESVDGDRLIGFKLALTPYTCGATIRYKTIVNKVGSTGWIEADNYSGTTDRRRKLIGFALELVGNIAEHYSIIYQAKLRGEEEWVSGQDGSICGTTKDGGDAIEDFRIMIQKKE